MPDHGNGAAGGGVALRFAGVDHRYGGGAGLSLRGVDLTVGAGEVLCLLGPSGCGKTTLLRVAAGLETPAAGEVYIGGERVSGGGGETVPPERRRAGLVFQDFALFPHLTVAENARFGLGARRSEESCQRAAEVLERVGLAGLADRYPHTLSGGQQQRLALARALAPGPRILLLDEPFSGLDAALRHRLREETLAILKSSRTATLMVTHHGEEAMHLGDRIALMRAGRIVQSGPVEEVYHRPASRYVATYLEEANVFAGTVEGGVVDVGVGRWPAPPGVGEGGAAEVVVRHGAVAILPPEAEGPPGDQPLPARVVASRLLGGRRLTELAVGPAAPGGGDAEVTLWASHPVAEPSTPGAAVRVAFRPDMVYVFPAEADG